MKTNWYSMVSQIQAQRNDPRPIEYIIGGSFFCGEWFIVTPSALIPRIETEALVRKVSGLTIHALQGVRKPCLSLRATAKARSEAISRRLLAKQPLCGQKPVSSGIASSVASLPPRNDDFRTACLECAPQVSSKNIRILDLGTGCGNIAITLAKRLNCKVYAVDISEEALKVAKRNAKMHGVEDLIEFYKSDWYSELDIEPVDIIVSNPPYISEEDWDSLPKDVKDYEPKIAFWGGGGGLMHYKEIISGAKKMLVPGGRIIMEIGYNQAEDVKNLLHGFKEIETIKDQFGNPRVVSAKNYGQINYKRR